MTDATVAAPEFEIISPPDQLMVDRSNELHEQVYHHLRTHVETALELGQVLTDCRKNIAHGDWMPWVKNNLKFTYKTAYRYMALWERRDKAKKILDSNVQFDLTDLYIAVGLLARRNESDEEDKRKKQQKRREAEERREEREDEADLAAFQATPKISEEEFQSIQKETPVETPEHPATPVIDVEATPDKDERPELSVDDGAKIYDRTVLFVDRLLSEFPDANHLEVIRNVFAALDVIEDEIKESLSPMT